jgi:hypothetical protein
MELLAYIMLSFLVLCAQGSDATEYAFVGRGDKCSKHAERTAWETEHFDEPFLTWRCVFWVSNNTAKTHGWGSLVLHITLRRQHEQSPSGAAVCKID